MCGIFALLNNRVDRDFIIEQFNKGQHRGPDNSQVYYENNIFIGFHRLAINGIDSISDQPILHSNILLICNGEIYNYKQLYENIDITPKTNSDCEVIIYLYEKFGIEYTLNLLDGVFGFILIDYNVNKIYVGRDPYGVRPIFCLKNKNVEDREDREDMIGFASEIKQLHGFIRVNENMEIRPVRPGSYMVLDIENSIWNITNEEKYTNYTLNRIGPAFETVKLDDITNNIHDIFCEAVIKRVQTTDRPIACLLSGGLDSSIVTSLVSRIYPEQLETYSIGLKDSEDLKYARKVALYLNTKHTEIIVSEEDFFATIPLVIKNIFNGDGSDEVMGGYLYMNHADNHLEFDRECKRLIRDIHHFDVLRSDRCISTNGLEPRTPFLDREFVNYYLSLPSNIRFEANQKQEKYLFRKAFDKDYLPKEILWRRKEAFSDGVSSQDRSWYKIIEEKVTKQRDIQYDIEASYSDNSPQTLEQLYYRTIFEKYYPNMGYHIPYFWMPKYINAVDSSARTLSIYEKKDNIELDA
jgi:asparagine synthase (glutamine-hydrolysing)